MPGARCTFLSEDLVDAQAAAKNAQLNKDIQANLRLPDDKQSIGLFHRQPPLCNPDAHLSRNQKEGLKEIGSLYQKFSMLPVEVQFALIMFGYLQSTEAQAYDDAIVKYLGYARKSDQDKQLIKFQKCLTGVIRHEKWIINNRASSGEVSLGFLWRHAKVEPEIDPEFNTLMIGGILLAQKTHSRMYAVPRTQKDISAFPLFYVGCYSGHSKGVVTTYDQVAGVKLHLDEIAALGIIFHGTSHAAAERIDASGMLHPMERQAVHFHSTCHLQKSGRRGSGLGRSRSDVFYILDAKRFIEAGGEVRLCCNGVINVPSHIPLTFLEQATTLRKQSNW